MVKPFANTKKGLLKRLFNNKFHNGVSFFGIGDSSNDVPFNSKNKWVLSLNQIDSDSEEDRRRV